jgi:hypothetical protein
MIRPMMIFVAVAVVLGAIGDFRQIVAREAERTNFSEACQYYEARAGSIRRSGPGEFVGFLADVCMAAEVSLDIGTPEQQGRADLFLSRIALLRQTVKEMNAERDVRAVEIGKATGRNPAFFLTRITPSGEFLIAHRMGLMLAFDAWLDSGAEFSLASYP